MKIDWRARIALAGSVGLLANAGLMFLVALWHNAHGDSSWLGDFLARTQPALQSAEHTMALIVYLILMAVALAEIPLTTIGLRALVRMTGRAARTVGPAVAAFVFFAAVYAAALVFLTQRLDLALTIAGTGVLRLFAVALGVIGFKSWSDEKAPARR